MNLGGFLRQLIFAAKLTGAETTVKKAWEESLNEIWKKTAFKQGEYEIMKQFGETLGRHDRVSQQKQILLALSHLAKTHDQPCHVLDAVIFSNQNRCAHMVRKISEAIGDLKDKTICVLGITFKAGTDDVRSSPAVSIARLLLGEGAKVQVYDPEGGINGKQEISEAEFALDAYQAAKGADAIVILTEWEEFKLLDFKRIKDTLAKPNIFDFRNILDGEKLKKLGLNYHRIGR